MIWARMIRNAAVLAASMALVVGCGSGSRPTESSSGSGGNPGSGFVGRAVTGHLGVPEQWLIMLHNVGITSPDREIVHASHTCDLVVEGSTLHVLDVREIVPFMRAPRGVNHIVVMNDDGRMVRAIGYVDQRPMRCDANRLLVYGALEVYDGERSASGNQLVFLEGGQRLYAETIDVATAPWREGTPDRAQ
jgi:hypothetical protein